MKPFDKDYMEKYDFVQNLSGTLNIAKPDMSCEFFLGQELKKEATQVKIIPSNEYVVISCANGYRYLVDVTSNSLSAIGKAIFERIMDK